MPPIAAKARLITPRAVVFEVISPSSAWLARIVEVRKYAAVPEILFHGVVESQTDGMQLLSRRHGTAPRTATPLGSGDMLDLHAARVPASIPVAAIDEGIGFDG